MCIRDRFACAQGRADGAIIEIVQFSADGHALGQRCQARGAVSQRIGDIMGGGLAVDGGVQRQNYLARGLILHAAGEFGDAQLLGADGIKRRKRAAQDVIAALARAGPLHRPKIGDVFNHANLAIGAGRICLLYTSRCV